MAAVPSKPPSLSTITAVFEQRADNTVQINKHRSATPPSRRVPHEIWNPCAVINATQWQDLSTLKCALDAETKPFSGRPLCDDVLVLQAEVGPDLLERE